MELSSEKYATPTFGIKATQMIKFQATFEKCISSYIDRQKSGCLQCARFLYTTKNKSIPNNQMTEILFPISSKSDLITCVYVCVTFIVHLNL